jgi:hypothetical protein
MKFEKYGGRLSAISYICGQMIEIGPGFGVDRTAKTSRCPSIFVISLE